MSAAAGKLVIVIAAISFCFSSASTHGGASVQLFEWSEFLNILVKINKIFIISMKVVE